MTEESVGPSSTEVPNTTDAGLSEGDERLLRFVIGRGSGVEDWDAWVEQVGDIDDHSHASFPMFPAAYARLDDLGVEHEWMPRLRGAYRKEWVAARTVESTTLQAADVLDAAGIGHLVPAGAALREVTDAPLPRWESDRVTVRWDEAPHALDALGEAGWVESAGARRERPRPALRRVRVVERALRGPDGTEIVLADHMIPGRPGRRAGDRVWSDARPNGRGLAHLPAHRDLARAVASDVGSPESGLVVCLLRLAALASANDDVLEITVDRTPWHPLDPLVESRLARFESVSGARVMRSPIDDRAPTGVSSRLGDAVTAARRWGPVGVVRAIGR